MHYLSVKLSYLSSSIKPMAVSDLRAAGLGQRKDVGIDIRIYARGPDHFERLIGGNGNKGLKGEGRG